MVVPPQHKRSFRASPAWRASRRLSPSRSKRIGRLLHLPGSSPARRTLQLRYFPRSQMPEFARLDIQLQGPVAYPLDFFYVMLDLLEHAPDLPVTSLDQRDFVPGIGCVAQQF